MTQRIFDIENEKDMVDLWDILPENIYKLMKDEYQAFLLDKNGEYIITVPHHFININWHDKTEIARPIQEATEAGDVWVNKTTGDRVQIKLSLTTIIFAWHKVGENIYTYDFDRDMFLKAFTYLGKSKATVNDLFKTENEK